MPQCFQRPSFPVCFYIELKNKHVNQCLNNWKSIFRKRQSKTRGTFCVPIICSTNVNHWILFVKTGHKLFKLLSKVEGHCHWLHWLYSPLWLFFVLVCWESGEHRQLLLFSFGTCSCWLQQPITADIFVCTPYSVFLLCIQVHGRAPAFCFPEFHAAAASTFWKRQIRCWIFYYKWVGMLISITDILVIDNILDSMFYFILCFQILIYVKVNKTI